jgi:hypothetical protein
LPRLYPQSHLHYLSWIHFLLFYLLARILILGFMVGGFGRPITKGLKYRLMPIDVTDSDYEAVRAGEMIAANPRDSVCLGELQADGMFSIAGQNTLDLAACCRAARDRRGLAFILIRVDPDAEYQVFVDFLDHLQAVSRWRGCHIRPIALAARDCSVAAGDQVLGKVSPSVHHELP